MSESESSNTAPAADRWLTRVLTPAAVIGALVVGLLLGNLGSTGSEDKDTDSASETGEETIWTCSMHPQIRSPEPGQCPICGMDLIPADQMSDNPYRVTLSERSVALAKLQTTAVGRSDERPEIRLLGRVDIDENRVRTVTPWTAGRIDRLFVRETGAQIRRGQIVARLYSPEVYAAMRDLIQATKQAKKLAGGLHGSQELASATLESARERLRLLGVPEREISGVEKSGKAPKDIEVRSSSAGTVIERLVDQGAYVQAGTPLYRVADLSGVWVQMDAYESDLPHLAIGQQVTLTVQSLPGEPFTGKISFIDPVVDHRTRTVQVRVEVDNEEGHLRPGMFAEALIETKTGEMHRLVVPASAVLFTGRRSVVYVEVPKAASPTYELRQVELGPRSGPVYPVRSGLAEGERVVTQGAFVLDADLQLGGGRSMMTLADDVSRGLARIEVPAEFARGLAPMVEDYLTVHEALASDDLDKAKAGLSSLDEHVKKFEATGSRQARDAWDAIAQPLSAHAKHGAGSKDIEDLRAAFEHVGIQVSILLQRFGNVTDRPLAVAHCPMSFEGRGADWVQRGTTIANPYFGSAMHRCGSIEATVKPGEALVLELDPAARPPAPEHDHSAPDHQH
jgi:Cu(I)/Ag(I) efflux system membrane fusion protein